ncbi:MAG: hypothetical protein AB4042_02135 [Leptolyngbyaceae cyanobacterium]
MSVLAKPLASLGPKSPDHGGAETTAESAPETPETSTNDPSTESSEMEGAESEELGEGAPESIPIEPESIEPESIEPESIEPESAEPEPAEINSESESAPIVPNHRLPEQDVTLGSEPLLQIQGSLETGDRITFQDGSLYDEYTLDGRAGQLLLITLESSEFDSYLILLNDSGNIIGQNDDVTPDNTNSSLMITLPDTDIYIVVASGFQQSSRGQYLLTVWTVD